MRAAGNEMGEAGMLGLGDIQTLLAMVGCVAITLFGVIYGAVNWNRGGGE